MFNSKIVNFASSKSNASVSKAMNLISLDGGNIDIWIAHVCDISDADLAFQYDYVISDTERKNYAKFLFDKDRRRYLITRALVRYVLSRYIPISPEKWQFDTTPRGRPTIANQHENIKDLVFNISHSNQIVLLGLRRGGRLGVDVEDLRSDVPIGVAESYFSDKEIKNLRLLRKESQAVRFLEIWTLKESYIKACGQGLTAPLSKFGFEWGAEQQLSAFFNEEISESACSWTFWQWAPMQSSVAALCVESQPGDELIVTTRHVVPFVSEEYVKFDARMSISCNKYSQT